MKQWIILTLTTISLGSPAFANYVCQNDDHEKLIVMHLPSVDMNAKSAQVLAILETSLPSQNFEGIYHQKWGYSLTDDQGQAVELHINRTWVEYGGKCGRCNPEPIEKTFAKLKVANGDIHNFTCQ